MKTIIVAGLAAAALAFASPALAHGDDDDWTAESYSAFTQQYQHIWDGIQHGVSDGSYTPWQARRFSRALQDIRAQAYWQDRSGAYDPEDIEQRLERLHDTMHAAHERGHERLDEQGYGGYGYGGAFGRYGYYGR